MLEGTIVRAYLRKHNRPMSGTMIVVADADGHENHLSRATLMSVLDKRIRCVTCGEYFTLPRRTKVQINEEIKNWLKQPSR